MIMVENPGHNPDPELTSFSCRLANQFRKLPEGERPNLIELLKEYGELVRGVLLLTLKGGQALSLYVMLLPILLDRLAMVFLTE